MLDLQETMDATVIELLDANWLSQHASALCAKTVPAHNTANCVLHYVDANHRSLLAKQMYTVSL